MAETEQDTRIIPTTGRNNCGGRCLLYAHVRDGRIVQMTTERPEDCPGEVPLTACVRGLQYHSTYENDRRLLYPMLRVGERGEGKFARIGWDEAVDRLAEQWTRIRDRYGPGSRYVNYATGVSAAFRPTALAKRLLSLDGGYLSSYNSYSTACIEPATRLMYGTSETGSSPETWLDSRLILLWGHNPAETRFDCSTMYWLKKAREKGIPIVVVDPRRSATVRALDAEWVPLRPATDSALLDAMAWVIQNEGLADRDFLDRCCLGYDRAHLPPAWAEAESVLDYLTGARDGIPKTPEWAEGITGVPAASVRSLALRYALAKPAALVQGWGPQRHGYGEQSARGAILLSCMTGNVGVSGGWAGGVGYLRGHAEPGLPIPPNPYPLSIPVFRWTDAVDHGRELTPLDGVRGGARLASDIKLLLNLAGNCLINQHGDVNRTAALLRDTSKCEYIVCSDLFLTASARFADLLLPGVSFLESENITAPWLWGDFLGFNNKAVEPPGECRFEYEWLSALAEKLGLAQEFTLGRSHADWLRAMYEQARLWEPELPDYDAFRAMGVFRYPKRAPHVAFRENRLDPERRPFPTISGKIELFSPAVAGAAFRAYFPPIPRYVPPPEGPQDPLRERFPLQLVGWHTLRRCHSIHDNNPALERVEPQRLWLHPADAEARGLAEGDMAEVWNDRGRVRVPVHVTEDVLPGVCALSQGAWYAPERDGADAGGCVNVLTSWRDTPFSHGNTQHTVLAEVRAAP